jgi:hypothetical protein
MDEARRAGESGPGVPERADQLLSKYAAVWIWTVFFATSGGMFFSYTTPPHRITFPGVASADLQKYLRLAGDFLYVSGLLASVGSSISLYLYFAFFLAPVVIFATAPDSPRRRRGAATFARWTYLLLVIAGLARIAPGLVSFVYESLLR